MPRIQIFAGDGMHFYGICLFEQSRFLGLEKGSLCFSCVLPRFLDPGYLV